MHNRSALARAMDSMLLAGLLFIALTCFFSVTLQNILYGVLCAIPISGLLLYAGVLWSRRRSGKLAKERAGKQHLHNWMLMGRQDALRTASMWIKFFGVEGIQPLEDSITGAYKGMPVSIACLQKPLEDSISSGDILELYRKHRGSEYLVILSNANFGSSAAAFAAQCEGPRIALIGSAELLPFLKELPISPDEVRAEDKKRRTVRLSRFIRYITDVSKQKRYLLYGFALLCVYIAFDWFAFLLPGLICIFLAVIARRSGESKGLFD